MRATKNQQLCMQRNVSIICDVRAFILGVWCSVLLEADRSGRLVAPGWRKRRVGDWPPSRRANRGGADRSFCVRARETKPKAAVALTKTVTRTTGSVKTIWESQKLFVPSDCPAGVVPHPFRITVFRIRFDFPARFIIRSTAGCITALRAA